MLTKTLLSIAAIAAALGGMAPQEGQAQSANPGPSKWNSEGIIRVEIVSDDFVARLIGDAEVPPVVTEASGGVRILFDEQNTRAEIRLNIRNGMRVTQAHLHCAPRGENGPIVSFLAGFHELGWDVDGSFVRGRFLTDENVLIENTPSATCPEEITNLVDLVDAMFNGNIYVNVHTVANPDGEVRGQLFPFSDIVTVSVSSRTAWQDTGASVATGDLLEIIASGSVRWDTAGHMSDPDGLPDSGLTSCSNSLVPGAPKHTLVGRIGASGSLAVDPTDFLVGSSFSQTATQSGNLFMAFNDCFVRADRSGLDSGGVGDNSGAYQAKILVTSP